MHLKRKKIPKTWPVARKGTKYLVRPSHGLKKSIPLLIILRELMGIAKNRKEAKKILNLKKVKVNGGVVKEEKFPLSLFDNLNLGGENFKIIFKNKKFDLVKVNEKEADEKISKVINKKILKKGRMQINLSDGRNYLIKEKVKTGDSVVIDLKENKIKEILILKEGCKIIFISGKHLGSEGVIEKIDKQNIIAKVGTENLNSRLKNLMVIK